MGVLGWPPDIVCVRASLRDLAEAYAGWAAHAQAPPDAAAPNTAALADFMQGMLARFPDTPRPKKKGNIQ